MNPTYNNLVFELDGKVARVTLNRPEVRNAFNKDLIEELRVAFAYVAEQPLGQIRAVVLAGAGKSFCAGADVNWMRASLDYSEEENVADALHMARMFDTLNRCPLPVIAKVHGAAMGGGVGLCAVCDIVVAASDALFAFSEAKLGIAPAVISPYVLARVGRGHARALFLTAERFGAERALQIGLVHLVAAPDALETEVQRLLAEVQSSAPHAIARAKELIADVPSLSTSNAMQHTAETIANLRVSAEGQEGLRAFLEKRTPGWAR